MGLASEALELREDEHETEAPAFPGVSYEPRRDSGCRSCGGLLHPFIDFGWNVMVCGECWLAQHRDDVSPAAISCRHAHFPSFSEAWLAHARDYGRHAVRRFNLGSGSVVIEVASDASGPPAAPTVFTHGTALDLVAQGKAADLVIGNNLLAQVPDLNDVLSGLAAVLKPTGILTLEFPHLMRLIGGKSRLRRGGSVADAGSRVGTRRPRTTRRLATVRPQRASENCAPACAPGVKTPRQSLVLPPICAVTTARDPSSVVRATRDISTTNM